MNFRGIVVGMLAGLVCFSSGCGSEKKGNREPTFPVTGKITYKGRPIEGADVTFYCKEKDRSAFGRTDSEGAFKLTTFASNDGAVPGKHVVVVTKVDVPPPTKIADISDPAYQPPKEGQSTSPPAKKLLPARYMDVKTSDLIAVVNGDGPNDMTLELKD